MKKSGLSLNRALLALLGSSAALCSQSHAQEYATNIFENYDNSPVGPIFGNVNDTVGTAIQTSGYGVSGKYTSLGTPYTDAFKIENGSLQFGALSPTTTGKKLKADGFGAAATAISVMIDGGKTIGDIQYNTIDKVYCSYLIQFTAVSNAPAARAEVRINGNATTAFEMHADGPAAPTSGQNNTIAQPRLGYQLNNFRYSPTPSAQGLVAGTGAPVYLMIGRFDQVGNYLGASGNFTYAAGSKNLVVSGTAFPSGLEVGNMIKGDAGSGIPDDSYVTALLTTTEGTATVRTVVINKDTTLASVAGGTSTLSTGSLVGDPNSTVTGRTNTNTTISNLPSVNGVKVGMIITGAGIQAGTVVTAVSGTTATISLPATATTAADISFTLRSTSPLLATFTPGAGSTITLDRIPVATVNGFPVVQISPGFLVEGAGIDEGTRVVSVDSTTKTLTLSKPTIAAAAPAGAASSVRIYNRSATGSMWALTETQYTNFISAGGTDAVLDTITIGSAANQATVKISSTQAVGSWEFGQGRRLEIVAFGGTTAAARQTFYIDEIRYGMTMQSVTKRLPLPTPAANTASDNMDKTFRFPHDGGSGWKSGYYEVEETASPQGAYLNSVASGGELRPGAGNHLAIYHRPEVSVDQGTRRRPDPAVVDLSQPYTVNFDYRIRSDYDFADAFTNRIQIGVDGPSGAGANFGPNPSAETNLTWMVGVIGGNEGTNRIFNASSGASSGANGAKQINIGNQLYWYFFDFDSSKYIGTEASPNYFVPTNMVSSGVSFSRTNPVTYAFQIEVNPLNYTYKATVTNLTTNETGTVANLRFRRQAPGHTLFWGISKPATSAARVVDLDNLKVIQGVPYVDPFPAWIATFPNVPAGSTGRNVDANGDGRPNFMDFALDGDPMSGARNFKEVQAVTNIGGINYYTITIPVRTGVTFGPSPYTGPRVSTQVDGITYKVQGSYDLVNWVPAAGVTVPDVVPLDTPVNVPAGIKTGWEAKSFRLGTATSAQPKAFMRVVVDNTITP